MGVPAGYIFILISGGSLSNQPGDSMVPFTGGRCKFKSVFIYLIFNKRWTLSCWLAGHFPFTLLDGEKVLQEMYILFKFYSISWFRLAIITVCIWANSFLEHVGTWKFNTFYILSQQPDFFFLFRSRSFYWKMFSVYEKCMR